MPDPVPAAVVAKVEMKPPPDATRLPVSVYQGSFHIFGVELIVHVLNDGQRVIEADSMTALFHAMETGEVDTPKEDIAKLTRFLHGRGIPAEPAAKEGG